MTIPVLSHSFIWEDSCAKIIASSSAADCDHSLLFSGQYSVQASCLERGKAKDSAFGKGQGEKEDEGGVFSGEDCPTRAGMSVHSCCCTMQLETIVICGQKFLVFSCCLQQCVYVLHTDNTSLYTN